MTPAEKAFAATVAGLTLVLDRENSAIDAQDLRRLRTLSEEKRKLLEHMENARIAGFSLAAREPMRKALSQINRKAAANAAALDALRQGALDARRRLEALAASEKKLGLYTAHGDQIRGEPAGSVARNV